MNTKYGKERIPRLQAFMDKTTSSTGQKRLRLY